MSKGTFWNRKSARRSKRTMAAYDDLYEIDFLVLYRSQMYLCLWEKLYNFQKGLEFLIAGFLGQRILELRTSPSMNLHLEFQFKINTITLKKPRFFGTKTTFNSKKNIYFYFRYRFSRMKFNKIRKIHKHFQRTFSLNHFHSLKNHKE